jgi:hypothetical protein
MAANRTATQADKAQIIPNPGDFFVVADGTAASSGIGGLFSHH